MQRASRWKHHVIFFRGSPLAVPNRKAWPISHCKARELTPGISDGPLLARLDETCGRPDELSLSARLKLDSMFRRFQNFYADYEKLLSRLHRPENPIVLSSGSSAGA